MLFRHSRQAEHGLPLLVFVANHPRHKAVGIKSKEIQFLHLSFGQDTHLVGGQCELPHTPRKFKKLNLCAGQCPYLRGCQTTHGIQRQDGEFGVVFANEIEHRVRPSVAAVVAQLRCRESGAVQAEQLFAAQGVDLRFRQGSDPRGTQRP